MELYFLCFVFTISYSFVHFLIFFSYEYKDCELKNISTFYLSIDYNYFLISSCSVPLVICTCRISFTPYFSNTYICFIKYAFRKIISILYGSLTWKWAIIASSMQTLPAGNNASVILLDFQLQSEYETIFCCLLARLSYRWHEIDTGDFNSTEEHPMTLPARVIFFERTLKE